MTFSRDMEIFNKWKFGLNSFQMDVKKWFSVRSHMKRQKSKSSILSLGDFHKNQHLIFIFTGRKMVNRMSLETGSENRKFCLKSFSTVRASQIVVAFHRDIEHFKIKK